jgi:hypothetical protein
VTLLRTGSIDNVWDRFVDKLSIACKDNVPVYKSKPNHYETPGWTKRDPSHSAEQKKEMEKVYILQEPAK